MERHTKQFPLLLTEREHAEIKAKASDAARSMSDYIRDVVADHISAGRKLKPPFEQTVSITKPKFQLVMESTGDPI